jgi:hypothetical protein
MYVAAFEPLIITFAVQKQISIMKKSLCLKCILLAVFLVSGFFTMTSCQKEAVKQGDLKAVIHYNSHTNGTLVYFSSQDVKVELIKDGTTIATQYSHGNTTIDFGNFDYRSYTLKSSGHEKWVNSQTAQQGDNGDFTKNTDFVMDASTKTVTVELP